VPDVPLKTISTWMTLILEMTSSNMNDGISDVLIVSDGMDQLAAFVALAIVTQQTGSVYEAMVHGAHCGLDRHLDSNLLDVLCQL